MPAPAPPEQPRWPRPKHTRLVSLQQGTFKERHPPHSPYPAAAQSAHPLCQPPGQGETHPTRASVQFWPLWAIRPTYLAAFCIDFHSYPLQAPIHLSCYAGYAPPLPAVRLIKTPPTSPHLCLLPFLLSSSGILVFVCVEGLNLTSPHLTITPPCLLQPHPVRLRGRSPHLQLPSLKPLQALH